MAKNPQRSIITPDHFGVAPEILGLPLASPSRRAIAMAIDLLLVVLLIKAGAVFLGLVAATLLFRASSRKILRVVGAVLIFWLVIKIWGSGKDMLERRTRPEPAAQHAAAIEGTNLKLNLAAGQMMKLGATIIKLKTSHDSVEIGAAATQLLGIAKSGGASVADIRETRADLIEMLGEEPDSSNVRAVQHAINVAVGDTAGAPALDTVQQKIASLESEVQQHEQKEDSLSRELVAARKAHGIRAFISGAADDMGVGFGWSAIYFTAFLALWSGQTPGKRIAGVKVLRLDGKPLGWWMSFERFGGYAASLSVGLLGFIQILWDRNRQGLHDKACETVVVRNNPQARVRA